MAEIACTDEAQRWLADIYDFIAADNPVAAAQTAQGIYERAQVLRTHPEIGHRYLASSRMSASSSMGTTGSPTL